MKKVLFLINPVSGKLVGQSLNDCIISELSGVIERDHYDIESETWHNPYRIRQRSCEFGWHFASL